MCEIPESRHTLDVAREKRREKREKKWRKWREGRWAAAGETRRGGKRWGGQMLGFLGTGKGSACLPVQTVDFLGAVLKGELAGSMESRGKVFKTLKKLTFKKLFSFPALHHQAQSDSWLCPWRSGWGLVMPLPIHRWLHTTTTRTPGIFQFLVAYLSVLWHFNYIYYKRFLIFYFSAHFYLHNRVLIETCSLSFLMASNWHSLTPPLTPVSFQFLVVSCTSFALFLASSYFLFSSS